jgi:hypothetical protein
MGTTFLRVAAFIVWLIGCALWSLLERSAFNGRFPPISDDEFMALCPSGTNRRVALKVREIVSRQLGVEYERIYPSSSYVNDLGAD